MFASNTDIQTWLQQDKVKVDDANSQKSNIDAMRTIKGQLSGLFAPITLASWADPSTTPEVIRSIAGRLAAAFMYRTIYSEESEAIPIYAQNLYNEAISMLADIKNGTLVVLDGSDVPIDTTGANILSFWPNNTIAPVFTMTDVFA